MSRGQDKLHYRGHHPIPVPKRTFFWWVSISRIGAGNGIEPMSPRFEIDPQLPRPARILPGSALPLHYHAGVMMRINLKTPRG